MVKMLLVFDNISLRFALDQLERAWRTCLFSSEDRLISN